MHKRRIVPLIILLILAGGGIAAYHHWRNCFRGDASDAPFAVTKVELKRDFANAILTLSIDYDNRDGAVDVNTAAPADDPNAARLVSGSGQAPSLFFLPGVLPPVVKAGEHREITIIYWLDADHLQSDLHFESNGERVAVKNGAHFELNQIENQKTVTFTDPNWSNSNQP